jgi:hypothetical protein
MLGEMPVGPAHLAEDAFAPSFGEILDFVRGVCVWSEVSVEQVDPRAVGAAGGRGNRRC